MTVPGILQRLTLKRFIGESSPTGTAFESRRTKPTGPYTIRVYDNFHFMDADEAYDQGSYATWNDALAEAKCIVEMSVQEARQGGDTAEAIFKMYTMFGDDPRIYPEPEGVHFSAWDYARQRCTELSADRSNAGRGNQR